MEQVRVVIILSGKRKSGKDHLSQIIQQRLGPECCKILRISEPLKAQYAKEHNLDLSRLLGDSSRTCGADVWIVSDVRRGSDMHYFTTTFPNTTLAVRVEADLSVREKRGFIFTAGIDNAESECGLDDYNDWHFVINNNDNQNILDIQIDALMREIDRRKS